MAPGAMARPEGLRGRGYPEPRRGCPCCPARLIKMQTYEYEGRVGVSGFHLQDGLYFQRGKDDSVTIVKTGGQAFDPVVEWELTVDTESWASAIASVSKHGDTAWAWEVARNFHKYGAPVTTGGA